MKQDHSKHVYFLFFNPLKVTGELEIESLGRVLKGQTCHGEKPVSFLSFDLASAVLHDVLQKS